jgi:hypothetical protein
MHIIYFEIDFFKDFHILRKLKARIDKFSFNLLDIGSFELFLLLK